MQGYEQFLEEDYIIYNKDIVLRDFVWIEKIEIKDYKAIAYLEEPYEMVFFDLEKLILNGKITFEACEVFTTQKWKEDEELIQKKAFFTQRKNQKEFDENINNFFRKKVNSIQQIEKKYRKLLDLPIHGELEKRQIKTAYKIIVKKVHPDVGGTHEAFIEVVRAKDILLENVV